MKMTTRIITGREAVDNLKKVRAWLRQKRGDVLSKKGNVIEVVFRRYQN